MSAASFPDQVDFWTIDVYGLFRKLAEQIVVFNGRGKSGPDRECGYESFRKDDKASGSVLEQWDTK